MSCVLFSDETRLTFDEPDGWANGSVYFGDERHKHLRRQQQGGGVMWWAGIIGDRHIGSVMVPEVFNAIAAVSCNLLNEVLDT